MNRKRTLLVIGLVVVLTLLWGSQTGQAVSRPPTKGPSSSVVLLIAADEGRGGRLIPKWSGAGAIISPDGLILTNCQVAFPKAVWDDPEFEYDVLLVVLAQDTPPSPTYIGEVAQYDASLDLAVVRITQALDGTPVDPKRLNLPALSVGDSDQVAVGDTLSVWGYDGAGIHAAESTEVQVTGFSSGRGIKGRAWISVYPDLEAQLSGSPALNAEDELVAVVAVGAAGSADDVTHCRYTEDTNENGTLDADDTCTGTGGAISAVRPVNLAATLIRAAEQNLAPQPTPAPTPKKVAPGAPSVGRMIFTPAIDEWEQPVTVAPSFPSGPEVIYFFFDYANFADGASWKPVLVYNGERMEDVWPDQQWEGGPQGMWWMSLSDDLPDGIYEFIVTYEGEDLGSATVQVGVPQEDYPAFANIVFSGGGEEGYFLPGGIKEIVATFDYANMTRDTEWSYIGYYEGEEIARGEGKPFSRSSGTTSLPLSSNKALDPGRYRLELYIDFRLAATADCVVQQGGMEEVFSPITFAEGEDRNGNPVNPGTTFQKGISELYAFFDYQGMQDGWTWARRWYIDGEVVAEAEDAWDYGESGENFWVRLYSQRQPLPEGEYQLDLLVEGELVQSGTCEIVGKAPRPTPTPTRPPKGGVEIYGRITDAATGKGIPSALFLVLKPGVTVEDFIKADMDESLIHTWAETDRNGDYQLPNPLARGEAYSMLIGAKGYIPIGEDDVGIPEDLESPYELNIELERVR